MRWGLIKRLILYILDTSLSYRNVQEVAVKTPNMQWVSCFLGKHNTMLNQQMYQSTLKQTYIHSSSCLCCAKWTQKLSVQTETFQDYMIRILTDHELVDNVKIISPFFDAICSKTSGQFRHIKWSCARFPKLCLEGMVPRKRSSEKSKQR